MSETGAIIRMERITKGFPGIVANDNIQLRVLTGAFHAVIGENGAGKSTLLNILYGKYRPDKGTIFLHGEDVTNVLRNPSDAIQRGIGLVSQHYALIPALTVLENIILGAEPTARGGALQLRQAEEHALQLARRLGLSDLDLNMRAERLSVAAGQKVEILKALYRGARILLLDEPTATLAPQEADALFALLHTLIAEGATVVFVTHKLREVMAHSDAVTVLRNGRNAGNFITSETSEQELLAYMIGLRTPLTPPAVKTQAKFVPEPGKTLLRLAGITVRNARRAEAVRNVSLEVRPGEIVGIAGVDGSGQRELSESIVGLRRVEIGQITFLEQDVTRWSVRRRQQAGLAYIPEDRHRAGMILDFSIAENYLLGREYRADWGGGAILHPGVFFDRAQKMISRYDVRVGNRNATAPARTLSGGNQQKVVIARALDGPPRLLIACQPTRGLDIEASRFVYRTLRTARDKGMGIVLFSLDLDEIFGLSDRIAVMFNGAIAGMLPRAEATPEIVGAWMTGATPPSEEKAEEPDKTPSGEDARDTVGVAAPAPASLYLPSAENKPDSSGGGTA